MKRTRLAALLALTLFSLAPASGEQRLPAAAKTAFGPVDIALAQPLRSTSAYLGAAEILGYSLLPRYGCAAATAPRWDQGAALPSRASMYSRPDYLFVAYVRQLLPFDSPLVLRFRLRGERIVWNGTSTLFASCDTASASAAPSALCIGGVAATALPLRLGHFLPESSLALEFAEGATAEQSRAGQAVAWELLDTVWVDRVHAGLLAVEHLLADAACAAPALSLLEEVLWSRFLPPPGRDAPEPERLRTLAAKVASKPHVAALLASAALRDGNPDLAQPRLSAFEGVDSGGSRAPSSGEIDGVLQALAAQTLLARGEEEPGRIALARAVVTRPHDVNLQRLVLSTAPRPAVSTAISAAVPPLAIPRWCAKATNWIGPTGGKLWWNQTAVIWLFTMPGRNLVSLHVSGTAAAGIAPRVVAAMDGRTLGKIDIDTRGEWWRLEIAGSSVDWRKLEVSFVNNGGAVAPDGRQEDRNAFLSEVCVEHRLQ
ncbi:MAG: hypothetical protein HYV63_23455 [Candidatus Schekmanbacteria bacterium]|nr:hypothetical protein [Candidatus Schekmanbacteria bacterium]